MYTSQCGAGKTGNVTKILMSTVRVGGRLTGLSTMYLFIMVVVMGYETLRPSWICLEGRVLGCRLRCAALLNFRDQGQ